MRDRRALIRDIHHKQPSGRPGSRETSMYLMQQPDEMAYQAMPHGLDNITGGSYDPRPPQTLLYDEAERPYFDRGATHEGVWRQYVCKSTRSIVILGTYIVQITGNRLEEPLFMPYLSHRGSAIHDLNGSSYDVSSFMQDVLESPKCTYTLLAVSVLSFSRPHSGPVVLRSELGSTHSSGDAGAGCSQCGLSCDPSG